MSTCTFSIPLFPRPHGAFQDPSSTVCHLGLVPPLLLPDGGVSAEISLPPISPWIPPKGTDSGRLMGDLRAK